MHPLDTATEFVKQGISPQELEQTYPGPLWKSLIPGVSRQESERARALYEEDPERMGKAPWSVRHPFAQAGLSALVGATVGKNIGIGVTGQAFGEGAGIRIGASSAGAIAALTLAAMYRRRRIRQGIEKYKEGL